MDRQQRFSTGSGGCSPHDKCIQGKIPVNEASDKLSHTCHKNFHCDESNELQNGTDLRRTNEGYDRLIIAPSTTAPPIIVCQLEMPTIETQQMVIE